jgi:O-antigen/teichoic acid export membrane protein
LSPLLTRIVNVALRGATLGSKFSLIFALAYYLEPNEVGVYGLLFAAVSYSLYVSGLEFYVFSTRELISASHNVWGGYLKSHAVLILCLYCVVMPLLFLLFNLDFLPQDFVAWFFIILVLEHFSQEFNRLLIASSKQVAASVVLFFRSGVWCIAVVAMMYLYPSLRTLDVVFFSWAMGAGLACVLSVIIIFRMRLGGWGSKVDWRWIKAGLVIALPFLLASLSIRGIFTLDRFFLEHYANLEVLGAYVLFVGICNALVSFLDASVFVFTYPVLIKSSQEGNVDLFLSTMKKLSIQTMLVAGFFVVSSLLMIDFVLDLIGKASYSENKDLFYLTLLAVVIFVASFVPQYGLYAQGHDRPIIMSSVFAVIVFIIFVYFWASHISYWAVPIGMILAFSVSFLWKTISYFKLTPKFSQKIDMG